MSTKQSAIAVIACALLATVTAFVAALLYDTQSAPTIVIQDAPSEVEIAISIDGAVQAPGVYTLPDNSRLADAIDAAGGLRDDADVAQLNLAERISDEQRISIPSTNATSSTPAMSIRGDGNAELIDINSASVAELDTLPGIGPVIAQRIVDYRDANGPFARIEELARVEGISAAMVDELEPLIVVSP